MQRSCHVAIIMEGNGRRDCVRPSLVRLIESSEEATAEGAQLRVRLAVDCSARDAIERGTCGICPERSFRQRL